MEKKLKSLALIIVFLMAFSANSNGQSSPFDTNQEYLIDEWATVLIWVDLDNDGLKDIIASGYKKEFYIDWSGDTIYFESEYSLYAYRNTENGEFERLDSINLGSVFNPIINTADFDNNGYMDIIISGSNNITIYKNSGNWNFEDVKPKITGLVNGDLSIVDFNNDGRTDFFINGQNQGGDVYSMLYMNRGAFEFTPIPTDIKGVRGGNAAWMDYDLDGYADLLLSGEHVTETMDLINFSAIYKNNGDGTFTHQNEIPIVGIRNGTAKWGDYNNDGNFDFLVANLDVSDEGIVNVYRNDGQNIFNHVSSYDIPTLMSSVLQWEDFNNNGYLDLVSMGNTWETIGGVDTLMHKSFYYEYDTIYQQIDLDLPPFMHYTHSSIADIDNNGTLDLVISGIPLDSKQNSNYVLYNQSQPNTPPNVPVNLTSEVKGNAVCLNWDQSSDAQTHPNTLTYRIRIGTAPDSLDIMSPAAIISTGERLNYQRGNIRKSIEGYPVTNLKPGIYYWSVQAIDGGYMSSGFAGEQTFTVDSVLFSSTPPVTITSKAISENMVELEWVYPIVDDAEFLIERSDIDSLHFQTIDTVGNMVYRYIDKNLIHGTGYYYRIKTLLNSQESDYSDTVFVTTRTQTYFTKIFDSPLTKDQFFTTGVALGDLNNNGLPDLCIINWLAPIQIFKNLGNGEFEEIILEQKLIDPESAMSPYGNNKSVNWVDIDNDGYLDLFITQGFTYPNILFINNGDETFTQITDSDITIDMGESLAAAWADYDNDGLVDVLICGWEQEIMLYRNLGDLMFEKVDAGFNENQPTNCAGCNWVDFKDDGFQDVFIVNYFERNLFYINNNDGTFEKVTEGAIVTDSEPSVSAAWGDYDNDGFIDLLVLNNVNMDNSLYRNMGDGTFTKPQTFPFANRTAGITGAGDMGAWEDITNNGSLDLFIAHNYNNRFFINKDEGSFTEVIDEPFYTDYGASFAAIWADFNNNGFLDLFVANHYNQENFYYINNGLGFIPDGQTKSTVVNNRVSIKLKGRNSNSFGLGARVVVESGDMIRTRHIATQSGTVSSTNGLIASVGIGHNENARATITWPTGYVQEINSLKINELNVIEEPEESVLPTSAINLNGTSDNLEISLYPNPVNSILNIRFSNAVIIKKVSITDLSGKVIRSIYHNVSNSSPFSININDLKPGFYYIIIETEKGRMVQKFCKILS